MDGFDIDEKALLTQLINVATNGHSSWPIYYAS